MTRDINGDEDGTKSLAAVLQEITSAIPGVVYRFRSDRNKSHSFPFISSGIEELYELKPAEVYEDAGRMFELVFKEDLPGLLQSIEESRNALTPWRRDFRIKTRSGKEKWLNGHSLPRLLPDGSVIWNGVLMEITEQKNVELRLQESQARLQFQYAVVGAFANATSLEKATEEILRQGCTLLGWDLGAFWIADDERTALRCVHLWHRADAAFPRFTQASRDLALAKGTGLPGRVWQSGLPVCVSDITKDGNFPRGPYAKEEGIHAAFCFPVIVKNETLGALEFFSRKEMTLSDDLAKLISTAGTQFGQFIARKLDEKQLGRSNAFKSAILETALDCIVTMDHEGLIREFNPVAEKTFGRRREDVIGKPLADIIVPPLLREAHVKGLARYLKSGEAKVLGRKIEITAMRSDGTEFPVELGIARLDIPGPPAFTGFIRDLTEQKKTSFQLMQSQKMETVGALAGGIAHDLNNQLTPVSGYIDFILKETDPSHLNYRMLSEANDAVRRAAEIVRRLLAFSRPSTEKKESLSLSRMFGDLKKLLARVLPATISVEIDCPEDLWPIHGNDTELDTVFMNLATNARDVMKSGGRFTISARNMDKDGNSLHEPAVVVRVTDTGCGMTPEVMQRIFEPFFTTKPVGSGTGLGLAMAFRIIKDHGGIVEVSSQPGKGTSFVICLPAKPGASVPSPAPSEARHQTPGGQETILFVDDVDSLRDLGKMFLESLGYKVLFAKDGEEAVEVYAAHASKIALVILDMTMPKMTGRETLHKILGINNKAKVLLVTGFTSEGTANELIAEGAKGFLGKPYTIGPLSQKIRQILDST